MPGIGRARNRPILLRVGAKADMTEEQTHIGITLGDPAGGSSHDGTACSMSLRRPTCDCVRRTVVSQYVSLLGMPASDWGASKQWCCLREGSGHDRRRQKGLRAEWGSLLFLPQLRNIGVLGA